MDVLNEKGRQIFNSFCIREEFYSFVWCALWIINCRYIYVNNNIYIIHSSGIHIGINNETWLSTFWSFLFTLLFYQIEPLKNGPAPVLPSSLSKGQLISKWFLGVIDFLQKTNERIRLYYYDTSSRLVFVRFLEEIDDPKKPFRN